MTKQVLMCLVALGFSGCALEAEPVSLATRPTPTIGEGSARLCAELRRLGCSTGAFCEIDPALEARVATTGCAPVVRDYFACMMRPQQHSCALLSKGLSAACVRIAEASTACIEGASAGQRGVSAPSGSALLSQPAEGSLVLESDRGGDAVITSPLRVTMVRAEGTGAPLAVTLSSTGATALQCGLRLQADVGGWYRLADADATPRCVIQHAGASHSLRFTAATAFQLSREARPRLWIEATAESPRIGSAAAMLVLFERLTTDSP